jgi:hypothetical protein
MSVNVEGLLQEVGQVELLAKRVETGLKLDET